MTTKILSTLLAFMSFELESQELGKPVNLLGSMDKPISVGDLTELIKANLETSFAQVVVVGEVSNFKSHPSGHFYFSLKDAKGTLSAAMFRGANSKLKFALKDGLKVIAFGRISVYPPRGSYQIIVSRLEPEGVGALQLAFEQLKKKLDEAGLFDKKFKKPIPKFPKKIGLVTSPSGAAVRDMLNVLDRRFAGLDICIYPAKVQGRGAAEEVAEAIKHFNKYFSDTDVLIVGRGGGSIEDLWAFNEEVVARAIHASKIPIISAVGHEVDFTIADFVADLRAPTPSAAAELVIGNRWELIQHLDNLVKRLLQVAKKIEYVEMQLDDLVQRMTHSMKEKLSAAQLDFSQLKSRLIQHNPTAVLAGYQHRAHHLFHRLREVPPRLFEKRKWQIESFESQLRLLNPRTIMSRGYSIVRNEKTKKVIKKASEVRMGDRLLIELSKGKIRARV